MPFIPAIVGAALIGAGSAGATALISSKSAKSQQKAALDAQKNDPLAAKQGELIDFQKQVGQWGFDQAKGLLPQAKEAIDIPYGQYKALLSGDSNQAMATLSPQMNQLSQQFAGAKKTIGELGPRGNIASLLGNLGTQEAGAKGAAFFDARNSALKGMGDSATQYGNLFNSTLSAGQGAAVPALQSLTATSISQSQLLAQQAQQRSEMLSGLGQGIGSLLASLLLQPKTGSSRSTSVHGSSRSSD